jgi:hypothetical protein
MTINEAEDIAKECAKAARLTAPGPYTAKVLTDAAEAIDWLLTELEEAERYSGDFEWGQEP